MVAAPAVQAAEPATAESPSGDVLLLDSLGQPVPTPIEKLEAQLDLALESHSRLYAPWTESYAGQLRTRYPFRDVAEATPLIAKLRVKKSETEIAAIQHATDVSMDAHRAAWKRLAAGQYEYNIAAIFLDTFLDRGCEGEGYRHGKRRAAVARGRDPSCARHCG